MDWYMSILPVPFKITTLAPRLLHGYLSSKEVIMNNEGEQIKWRHKKRI